MDFYLPENNPVAAKDTISNLWSKYFPYWPFYLLLLILFLCAAWFYLQKTAPLYEATATILIKDEKKGIDDSRMMESLNVLSTKKIVENEVEVLASRSLMEEVVAKLALYAPVFKKSKWRSVSAYAASPVRVEVQDPESIIENPRIDFSFDTTKQVVTVDGYGFPIGVWVNTQYGNLKFTRSEKKTTLHEGAFYFSLLKPQRVVDELMKRLDASPSNKLSTVINLKLKNESAPLAEDILNQLIQQYNQASLNNKNLLAATTLSFVQERLDFVGRHLDSIEKRIEQYKSKQGAVDISAQSKLFLENVSANDQKLANMNMQLAALQQVEKYLLSKDKTGIVPSTLDDPLSLLPTMLKKLNEVELEKEKLRKTTAENNSMMTALNDQAAKLTASISENVQSQRKNLEASKANLSATNSSYSSLLQTIPQKERDLVEISRQQNIENNIYSFLLQKREEAALSHSSTVADNRLIDKAKSSLLPVSPSKILVYLVAIICAIGTGLLIITVKELFNSRILYRSEIENLTAATVLGEISFSKSANSFVFSEAASGRVAEQFRKLRASLKSLGLGTTGKSILITSTIANDGKSFITANLGHSLALSGKKVVLIDADLINPSLTGNFNIHQDRGLSNYLDGNQTPNQFICASGIHDNLFLVPAGAPPLNPSELLLNGKMEELIRYLSDNFDFILVDTAPVSAKSDAYSLSPLCHATIYVIRHAHTPRPAIEKLDKVNRVNELKNMAIVFNGIQTRGFGSDVYGQDQGYGHA